MRVRRNLAVVLALIAAAAGVTFVIRDRAVPRVPNATPTLQEFRIGLVGMGEINTLDPAKANTTAPLIVVWQLHGRLVSVGAEGAVVPMLASSWSASDDLKLWRFSINPKANFWGSGAQSSRRGT